MKYQFKVESELSVCQELLAAECLNMRGVNQELSPLVKMIVSKPWANTPMIQWPLHRKVCSSLVLLFGFLPIDVHQFRFHSITGSGFSERSTTFTNKEWSHDRTLQQCAQGSKIVDNVSFESRIPFAGSFLQPIYKRIFLHRHRRLIHMYGSRHHS